MSSKKKISSLNLSKQKIYPDPSAQEAYASYANQDHVPQRETTMPGCNLDKIDSTDLADPWGANVERPKGVPSLKNIFKEAKITPIQQQVLELYLFEGKTFFEIGQSLGVTRICAYRNFDKAIKKAQKRLADSGWVKGLSFKAHDSLQQPSLDTPKNFTDPYQFYSVCPECSHWDLEPTETGGVCLQCGWDFTAPNDESQKTKKGF